MCMLCNAAEGGYDDAAHAAALAWGTAQLDQYRAWIHQGVMMIQAEGTDQDLASTWAKIIVSLRDAPLLREARTPEVAIMNLLAAVAAAMIEAAYPSQQVPDIV